MFDLEPNFKFYEIDEIIKLLQSKERLIYVDDGIEEAVIRYKDLPDFIVDYNEKCGKEVIYDERHKEHKKRSGSNAICLHGIRCGTDSGRSRGK